MKLVAVCIYGRIEQVGITFVEADKVVVEIVRTELASPTKGVGVGDRIYRNESRTVENEISLSYYPGLVTANYISSAARSIMRKDIRHTNTC